MSVELSVVVPVRDEASHLAGTVEALVEAVERSGWEAEVVLVDDGSKDGSADVVRRVLDERLSLNVVTSENRGRLEARRAGLREARGELALLLDARVRIAADALAFVRPRVEAGERVWTSHVHVADDGHPLGVFWRLLAEIAWSEYFDDPRTTSFGAEDFDRYPKGTTCFLAPRALVLEALDAFRSGYDDPRQANDDTPPIRWIAEREPIHVSPGYSSTYVPRTGLARFVRHARHRGVVFVDGHGRPESRFFPVVVAFFPLSAAWAAVAARRPALVPATAVAVGLGGAAYGIVTRRTAAEIRSLALAAPVYCAAHGLGMWAGLAMLARRACVGVAQRSKPSE